MAGVVGALEVEDIRVAADRAGRGARRVDQDVVEHDAAAPRRCVAGNCPGLELQAVEVGAQAFEAIEGHIESRHLGAETCELRGLAARCSAEVEDAVTRLRADQAGGQAGGCVLHPPFASGIARQVLDPAAGCAAQGAGRQDDRGEFARPVVGGGRILQRDVEGGFAERCGGDPSGRFLAVCGTPAVNHPGRYIRGRIGGFRQECRAFFGYAPQDGVRETVEVGGLGAQAGEFDGIRYGGVRGDGEDRQFGGAREEDQADADRIVGEWLLEEAVHDAVEIGVAAQDGHREQARERLVAGVEAGEVFAREELW